jgi:aminoglycoside 6-adenylyltransferase
VEEFWFEAWHIPKYLQRGDLWVVKSRDWTMKELLLRMLEWHALAANGRAHDVEHIGIRMKDWTRPDIWKRLHELFGRFDGADSGRALIATVSLFRDVAVETAARLAYTYPRHVDDAISSYIAGLVDSPD